MRSVQSVICLTLAIIAVPWSTMTRAAEPAAPRWKPAYKIRPSEKHRLTAADVVGPDGIVYPDWRYAGVPGGIPSVPEKARIEQFGGKADDGRDDSRALAAGARAVAERGGGALVLGRGMYHLDLPVTITDDRVVIRGKGAEATKIVFRYGSPEGGVGFLMPRAGDVVGPDTYIEVHARPEGLKRIAVEADGKVLSQKSRGAHWGGTYSLGLAGDRVVRNLGAGPCKLTAVAEWDGGRRGEAVIEVRVDPQHRLPSGRRQVFAGTRAAIMFLGDSGGGGTWKLARDGKRGEKHLLLQTEPELKPGDALEVTAPATPRWNRLVQNACQWGSYRSYHFRVEGVDGRRVELNQPLRYEFPVVDGSYARRILPVRRCGVEDLCLQQTQRLWTTGVFFNCAWECWARGVKVVKAGRHAVYAGRAKWCEIRDCVMDDAWYHGGGGTAYVGWERSYDCLMEDVTTYRMRHAPCVQWSSSGNVIRRSTFHGSDAQWHAGWTNENLFEQCVVDAGGKHGSYGHGAWASPPEDKAHGPEGPRNVVYNCDIRSAKTGLWMGGMNENWLILYNRFLVGSGPGIYARTFSFDHVIRGNVIALAQATQPAVRLATADCTGIELIGNRIYGGNGQLSGGAGRPLVAEGNTLGDLADDPPRPVPEVPSIFEWQRPNCERSGPPGHGLGTVNPGTHAMESARPEQTGSITGLLRSYQRTTPKAFDSIAQGRAAHPELRKCQ